MTGCMGLTTLTVPLPRGWAPSVLESQLTGGVDGVEARLRALSAADEYHDLAIARDTGDAGVARVDDGFLIFGWSDAAGECSLLAAYAHHLLLVRILVLDLLDLDIGAVTRSGAFAEVDGRLVARGREAFEVQAIRAGDPRTLPTSAAPEVWEGLARACLCPACTSRDWSDDALCGGAELTRRALSRCVARTPRLMRLLIEAGAHPRSLDPRLRDLMPRWGPRTLEAALPVGQELLGARSPRVRAAAVDAVLSATEDAAVAADALAGPPRVAYTAVAAIRGFRQPAPLLPAVLDTLEGTRNGDVARVALITLTEGRGHLGAPQLERLQALARKWSSHRLAGHAAADALAATTT